MPKMAKKIMESQYVRQCKQISPSARDFIAKLLAAKSANRMNVSAALKHEWICQTNKGNNVCIDGSIYHSMYQHHQQKLKKKYKILSKQLQKKQFVAEKRKIQRKISKI